MVDGADPPDQPQAPAGEQWLTVKRAEVALAVSLALLVVVYVVPDFPAAIRFVVTFAAGAIALVSVRRLVGRQDDARDGEP